MAYPKSAITYNESSSAFSSSAKFTFFSSNIFSSSTKQREKKEVKQPLSETKTLNLKQKIPYLTAFEMSAFNFTWNYNIALLTWRFGQYRFFHVKLNVKFHESLYLNETHEVLIVHQLRQTVPLLKYH